MPVGGGLPSRLVDETFFSRGGTASAFAALDPDSRELTFGGMWTTSWTDFGAWDSGWGALRDGRRERGAAAVVDGAGGFTVGVGLEPEELLRRTRRWPGTSVVIKKL